MEGVHRHYTLYFLPVLVKNVWRTYTWKLKGGSAQCTKTMSDRAKLRPGNDECCSEENTDIAIATMPKLSKTAYQKSLLGKGKYTRRREGKGRADD